MRRVPICLVSLACLCFGPPRLTMWFMRRGVHNRPSAAALGVEPVGDLLAAPAVNPPHAHVDELPRSRYCSGLALSRVEC